MWRALARLSFSLERPLATRPKPLKWPTVQLRALSTQFRASTQDVSSVPGGSPTLSSSPSPAPSPEKASLASQWLTPLPQDPPPAKPDGLHFVSQTSKLPVPFRLDAAFVAAFAQKPAPFGFNGLGEFVYRRTYSRLKEDGERERWHETVERVVCGTFTMALRFHGAKRDAGHPVPSWSADEAQALAQDMYRRIFEMKFLPPGRGLWAMGSALTEEREMYAALNNCAFVSTKDLAEAKSRPFCFLMDSSMLGVGVGFDTRGAGALEVFTPEAEEPAVYEIPDSREGWVESVRRLLDAHFTEGAPLPRFGFSRIRAAGVPIRGFGGVSQGPGILEKLHAELRRVLTPGRITTTQIVDIFNLIGVCVVAGNVRRTAEIAFGSHDDAEFLSLKDYGARPERAAHGWTSNNSIFAEVGMDYSANDLPERIADNGEPGFAWLDNMRMYSRMREDERTLVDARAEGGNPCLEQTLHTYEMCNLVETFPLRHDSLEDFEDTLRVAMLYGKIVSLGGSHWAESNDVMWRNRRVGVSVSGVAQVIASRGIESLRKWLDAGYEALERFDAEASALFGVPLALKRTSVKPSGTVSLLAGATPGLHYPEAEYYVRRVRLAANSELLPSLRSAGYPIEAAVGDSTAVVVEFPVHAGDGVRTTRDVTMWEQLGLAAFLQRWWADNQVSCTVTFDPATEGPQLPHALDLYQYQLKGISFLPRIAAGAYAQMPYEAIEASEYERRAAGLKPLLLEYGPEGKKLEEMPDKFCGTDACSTE